MKKLAAFSAICFLFFSFVFAREISSVRISSEGVNLSNSENNWLLDMVEEKLDSNLSKYTDLIIINSTNKRDIIDAQKNSGDYIEAGKYKNASHLLIIKITKARSNYIITVRLTDITTGENLATVTSNGRRDSEELYSGHGCAIDEITIALNDKLNLGISDLQKKCIMEGEDSLTDEEKNEIFKSDIKQYESIVSRLDRELASLRNASSMEDIAKKRALEERKAEAEEKLNLAAENKKRADAEAKKKHEDELKNKDRTSEQINKINSATSNINDKIATLRSKKKEELSLLQVVKIIELKKEAYIETRNNLEKDLAEMQRDIDEKRAAVIAEIDNRPYRSAEKSNGKPTEAAIKNREEEKKYAMKKIDSEDVADMDDFNKRISGELKKIEREINSDYREMKPKTLTSLTDELIVTYDNYDGELEGWPLSVFVQIDDISILETKSFLPYNAVTGKRAVTDIRVSHSQDPEKQALFQEFADNVDYYNSLFSQGQQVFTFSLDYCIYPMDKNHPSEHEIKFSNFSVYPTNDISIRGNKISSKSRGVLKLVESSVPRQFYPIHDMRTKAELAEWNRHEKEREKDREAQIRKEERAKEREEKVSEISENINSFFGDLGDKVDGAILYHSENLDTNLIDFSFEATGGGVTGAGFEACYNYSFTEKFYLGYALDVIFSNNSNYYGLTDFNDGAVVTNQALVGYKFDMDWIFGDLFDDVNFMTMPVVYTALGLGFNVCSPAYGDTSANFVTEIQTGMETTLADTFQVLSSIQLLLGFGKQEATGAGAMACFSWTLGAGYRF